MRNRISLSMIVRDEGAQLRECLESVAGFVDEMVVLDTGSQDDTVAIAHLKPVRDDDGHVKLQRAYDFEYSDTGNNRLQGSIVLLGHRVTLLNVGLRLPPEVRTLH